MRLTVALDRPSRLGLATALGTAAGVLALCIAFELVVPASVGGAVLDHVGDKNLNMRSIILYVTAGGMHTLLCCGGIIFFFDQLRREQSATEFKKTVAYSLLAFGIMCAIILAACILKLNVVEHSFQDRIRPLESDTHLAFLVGPRELKLVNLSFRPFAVFPLLLTFAGVAVAVAACFWIAQKATRFADRADDLKPLQIAELKRSVGQLIALTTVVFTTSTIATITLMQIARDWVGKGAIRDAYIQNGHAMSIFWSANYCCATVLMVILPLWWIAARTRRIQRQAKHAGERATFWDQIFEVVSFKSVVQAGCATLAPLLTSTFAAAFGS
jgi:hypothetical protein